MRNIIITTAFALALIMISMSLAHAASESTPAIAGQTDILTRERGGRVHLQVRLYNAGVVPAADQMAAVRAAAMVLAAAGIDTTWLTCGYPTSTVSPMPCDTPLGASELSVRLVELLAVPLVNGDLELGYSLVDTTVHRGKLATVYVDRVRWLATRAGANSPTLVGLAIAHEIGHLLLGTTGHARSGLMRAVWSRAELQRRRAGDWRFAAAEASQMRSSLARREGLRSSQLDSHATGCLAPLGCAPGAPTAATDGGGHPLASVRRVAAAADR